MCFKELQRLYDRAVLPQRWDRRQFRKLCHFVLDEFNAFAFDVGPFGVSLGIDRDILTSIHLVARAGGEVRVSLRVASHADVLGPRCATVTIQDTGCGIAPEHLPHIFDRFYQVDPSRHATIGTGLGLAICQAIVTAHQGAIRINSVAGQGTVVEVEFTTLS